MSNSFLINPEVLDKIIHSKLKNDLDNLKGYFFEGDESNRINLHRFLVFYDPDFHAKSLIKINNQSRWVNAYYWYSVYIFELKNQNTSIENYSQLKFKLIEQIDHYCNSEFDWSIIEEIDNQFNAS